MANAEETTNQPFCGLLIHLPQPFPPICCLRSRCLLYDPLGYSYDSTRCLLLLLLHLQDTFTSIAQLLGVDTGKKLLLAVLHLSFSCSLVGVSSRPDFVFCLLDKFDKHPPLPSLFTHSHTMADAQSASDMQATMLGGAKKGPDSQSVTKRCVLLPVAHG